MKWATRAGVHVDRVGCAWLIRRAIDPEGVFLFVSDLTEVPADAVAFDMPGADLAHRDTDCTFETILRQYEIQDPVLWKIGELIHEADLEDELYDAPEAPGLDVIVTGLSMTLGDEDVLAVTGLVLDGLYEYFKHGLILGRGNS